MYVPLSDNTPQHDQIDEVVDYDFVRREVTRIIERGHVVCRKPCATPCWTPCWRTHKSRRRVCPRASPMCTTTAKR